MILGVPKEIKNNENRVGMTPSGVAEVVKHGHSVYVQTGAGVHSGFSDEAYVAAGIMCTAQAADSLTFTCSTVPTVDIIMYITITEVAAG